MNNPITRKRSALVVALLALGLGGAALADSGPDCGYGHGRGERRGESGMRWEMMQQHHEQRLAELKTALKLRADQEPAWAKFEAATRAPHMTPEEMKAQRGRLEGNNAIERHKARVDFMEERLADMKTTGAALEELYGTLDAEQKATLDRFHDMRWPGPGMKRNAPPAPTAPPAPAAPKS